MMNAWSNIELSPQDSEIIEINELEERIGELPANVKRIRELITRFEVCHFKYQRHIKKIKDSIDCLNADLDTSRIGANHLQHGEEALNRDITGKSLLGQQYVWAIREWLNDHSENEFSGRYDRKLGQRIHKWLGDREPDKIRLARLLLARLLWDWKSYETLQQGAKMKDIEFQASRMDICHYAFPENLDLLLQAIGRMEAVEEEKFEGCGSYNATMKTALINEFIDLNNILKSFQVNYLSSIDDVMKKWLVACLAKTIKEQIKIPTPMIDMRT